MRPSVVIILLLSVVLAPAGHSQPVRPASHDAGVSTGPEGDPIFIYFREHVLSTVERKATSVFAIDLDGDGDTDILSTSDENWTVVWYENLGGSPPAFTKHTITEAARNARSVYATDLDADGDVDVVHGALLGDMVAWHENDGGSPPTFTTHLVSDQAFGTWSIYATDMDGDSDVDLVSAAVIHSRIAWWESDGAETPTFTEHVITNTAKWAQSAHAEDIDGDGDKDIVSASRDDNTIAWFESDGLTPPTFTKIFIKQALGAKSVYATDIDGDSDIDVVGAARLSDKVAWYENNGAADPLLEERIITTNADGAISVYATDVNDDGDIDVLSASDQDNRIAWYESNGGTPPTFSEWTISKKARSATGVYATDIDGDGDVDALSSSWKDGKVAWYEQLSFGIALDGMTLGNTICRNLSTGTKGSGEANGPTSWRCEDIGAVTNSGDSMFLFSAGVADGTGPVGGTVTGLSIYAPRSVTCRNLTTAQTVKFDMDGRTWDCEAEGLVVSPGDPVQQLVVGEA